MAYRKLDRSCGGIAMLDLIGNVLYVCSCFLSGFVLPLLWRAA